MVSGRLQGNTVKKAWECVMAMRRHVVVDILMVDQKAGRTIARHGLRVKIYPPMVYL